MNYSSTLRWIEKNGLTIVEAQRDATVCTLGRRVDARVTAAGRTAGRAAGLWQRVAAFAMTPTRRTVPYF